MKKRYILFFVPIFIFGIFLLFISLAKADACSSFVYSDWSACVSNGQQTRTVTSSSPDGCTDGNPVLTQSCSYTQDIGACGPNDYSCGDWGPCLKEISHLFSTDRAGSGYRTRTCNKTSNCQGGVLSPNTSEYCYYIPMCTPSDWSCSS